MPTGISPPLYIVSADLRSRDICFTRNSRSHSWNQSWGASWRHNGAVPAVGGWEALAGLRSSVWIHSVDRESTASAALDPIGPESAPEYQLSLRDLKHRKWNHREILCNNYWTELQWRITESQNILSWEGPTRIVESNCWLHTGQPKIQTKRWWENDCVVERISCWRSV